MEVCIWRAADVEMKPGLRLLVLDCAMKSSLRKGLQGDKLLAMPSLGRSINGKGLESPDVCVKSYAVRELVRGKEQRG